MGAEKSIIIKRYQNRKLYDTQNSTYVTLDDIAKMIKAGDDVQILDNRTKEDLTAVTLTQIIFEEEKKKKSLLPLSALKNIIQEGGGTIREFFESKIESGVESITKVKEGAERVVDRIRDGLQQSDDNILQEVLHKTQDLSEKIRSTVGSVAHVTTIQNENRHLRKKIAMLEKRLSEIKK